MQNNLEYLLENMFDFSDKSCFYFIQILDRTKKWNNKNRCVKSYFVDSREDLLAKREEMITISTATWARVYVHPARRRKSKIDLELIAYIANRLVESNLCNKMWRAYESVCGRNKWVETRWLIDVDTKDIWYLDEVMLSLEDLWLQCSDYLLVNTVKWFHIITKRKFDLKRFQETFPWIYVHSNNPTILFAP